MCSPVPDLLCCCNGRSLLHPPVGRGPDGSRFRLLPPLRLPVIKLVLLLHSSSPSSSAFNGRRAGRSSEIDHASGSNQHAPSISSLISRSDLMCPLSSPLHSTIQWIYVWERGWGAQMVQVRTLPGEMLQFVLVYLLLFISNRIRCVAGALGVIFIDRQVGASAMVACCLPIFSSASALILPVHRCQRYLSSCLSSDSEVCLFVPCVIGKNC